MTYRIGGQVVDQGSGVADQPVFVVDTGDADPTNWTVEAATTTAADGSWSVVVSSGDLERYHAVTQFEGGSTLKNAESKPFVTGQPVVRPVEIPIQFNVSAPQTIGVTIPDTVVTRDSDNNTISNADYFGFVITTKSSWESIGARISANTSGLTRAYLRDNNGNEIQSVDISNSSSGDTFTFDGVNLQSGTDYRIVADAEGSTYTVGFFDNTLSYPYTSDDVDIIKRVRSGTVNESNPANINDIGNPDGVLN